MVAGFRFPQDRLAFVYTSPDQPILMSGFHPITIYLDETATVLAPIRTLTGVLVPGSVIDIGPDGLVEEFLGPDAADLGSRLIRLWARGPIGNTYLLEAQYSLWVARASDLGAFSGVYRQSSPAASWTWIHNLGRKPSVVVTLDNSPTMQVFPDVEYLDDNTIALEFSAPCTGYAEI